MEEGQAIELYASEIMQWITRVAVPTHLPIYLETFCKRVAVKLQVQVSFDERLPTSILLLLDTLKLQSFDSQHPNLKRQLLAEVGKLFYSQGYIGKRHFHQITRKADERIIHLIRQFIDSISDLEHCQPAQIKEMWRKVVGF